MSNDNKLYSPSIQEIAAKVRLLIVDVDGVLTNGELFFFEGGEYKAFHSRDGLGIALLLRSGIELAVISGNQSEAVARRFQKFGVKHVYQGIEDKRVAYAKILADLSLSDEQVAYMGDDLIDLPVMSKVALPTAVADADVFVKQHALWVSQYNGGSGAVRELCELILSAQGKWETLCQSFLD